MQSLLPLSSSPEIIAFGWMLVHSIWQICTVFIFAYLLFYLLKDHSPTLRYHIGVGAFALQLVISGTTYGYYYSRLTAISGEVIAKSQQYIPLPLPATNLDVLPLAPLVTVQSWLSVHIHQFVAIWCLGSLVFLLRLCIGWRYTQHLRNRSLRINDEKWISRFNQLLTNMGLTQSVGLLESGMITTPMVIGFLKPVVLVPIGMLTQLPMAQVEVILAHELAHIKRNDYFVNLLQSFFEIIFFFHPAVWILSSKIRTERENCCDDLALTVQNDRFSLAKALVSVAAWQKPILVAQSFSSQKANLSTRVKRIIGMETKASNPFRNQPFMYMTIGLFIGLSIFAIGKQSEKKDSNSNLEQQKNEPKRFNSLTAIHADTIYLNENLVLNHEIEKNISLDTLNLNLNQNSFAFEPMDFKMENFEFDASNFNIDLSDLKIDIPALKLQLNDTLLKKMEGFQLNMERYQKEMEVLQKQMEAASIKLQNKHLNLTEIHKKAENIHAQNTGLFQKYSELIHKKEMLLEQKENKSKSDVKKLEKQIVKVDNQLATLEKPMADFKKQISLIKVNTEALTNSIEFKNFQKEVAVISKKMAEIGAKMQREVVGKALVSPAPPEAPVAPASPNVPQPVPPVNPIAAPLPPTPPIK